MKCATPSGNMMRWGPIAGPLTSLIRSAVVCSMVYEMYGSSLIRWVHAHDSADAELTSLRLILAAAQDHQFQMAQRAASALPAECRLVTVGVTGQLQAVAKTTVSDSRFYHPSGTAASDNPAAPRRTFITVREYSLTVTSRRDELVEIGMRLFAERGYASTSVADVQTACGMTAGSGALYKHFVSKQALLEAGVHRYLEDLQARGHGFIAQLPNDPVAALRVIASAVTAAMTEDRSVIRVTFRDLEGLPDLLDLLWQGLVEVLYDELTNWIDIQTERGRLEAVDPAATAAVLMASLTYPPVLNALVGRRPGNVAPQAYLTAWIDSAAATLRATSDSPR